MYYMTAPIAIVCQVVFSKICLNKELCPQTVPEPETLLLFPGGACRAGGNPVPYHTDHKKEYCFFVAGKRFSLKCSFRDGDLRVNRMNHK